MKDKGREYSDETLKALEKKIKEEYGKAYEEVRKKADAYMEKFQKEDEERRPDKQSGKEWDEYVKWRSGKIASGKTYSDMADAIAADLANADAVAVSMVRGNLPGVYAENMNWSTYQIEKGTTIDTAFTLYDKDTVARLVVDQPDLLPKPKTNIPKDKRWNKEHVNSAILQGLLQGESMRDVAKRLQSVVGMDYRAAMSTARTSVNGAENAGRVDSYRRAQGMGINVKKEWLATLDMRTRHSHRNLDGEVVDVDEKFSNGLEYPGDPSGSASEVYNCRCTLVANLEDYHADKVNRYSKIGDMTYDEWKNSKPKESASYTSGNVIGRWQRRKDQFDFEIEDVMDYQGYDGLPKVVDQEEFDAAVKAANGGDGFIAQRSYTGSTKEIADEYRRQLYYGKWYVDCSIGGAQYGQGMYCAADWTGKLTDGIKREMEHYTSLGMLRDGDKRSVVSYIETLTLDSSAKVVTYEEINVLKSGKYANDEALKKMYAGSGLTDIENAIFKREVTRDATAEEKNRARQFERSNPDEYDDIAERLGSTFDGYRREIQDEVEKYDNISSFAAAIGYDAINAVGHGASGSYTVILNRTKMIVLRPEGWKK